jgi:hypothetical protein
MPHYKTLLDPGIFLGPQDFPKPRAVKISRIVREQLPERDGDEKKAAPMLYMTAKDGSEYPRKMKLPKSVLYGLSEMLGTDTDAWVGKEITIFAAKCMSFGDVEECLRVQFPPDIDAKIRKWLKKRKANPSAYMIRDSAQGSPS